MNIIETNLTFGTMNDRSNTIGIVLHHAAATTCTVSDIHSWHLAQGWAGIGYHYFISKNGEIYRGRPESKQGAHSPSRNGDTIGICVEGNYHETDTSMPDAQKDAVISLCIDIIARIRFSKSSVWGHKECDSTVCPGQYYPLYDITQEIINTLPPWF